MAFVGVVIVGGGVFVTQILPATFQRALQPLAAHEAPPPIPKAAVPSRSATTPAPVAMPATPAAAGQTPQELVEQRRAAFLAAGELQREKNHAWLAYYSVPASCEHPVDWPAQVECGNQYMRAKYVFDAQWAKEHEPGKAVAPVVVLGNGSVGGVGR